MRKNFLFYLVSFICATVIYAAPIVFANPFIVKSYKVSPKPQIDKWSTIEITIKCEGETADSLPIIINASGIEIDAPAPKNILVEKKNTNSHGIPYKQVIAGHEGQLQSWKGINKGDERTYCFRIRPYWYGKLGLDIQSINFIYYIGIGDDGKSTFAGTSVELEDIIGKPQAPSKNDPEIMGYTSEQNEKRNALVSKRKRGLKIDSTDTHYILSGVGYDDILHQDYYIPRNLKKGETRSIEVIILSRSKASEFPVFVPIRSDNCASVEMKQDKIDFDKPKEGIYHGRIEVTATKDDRQAVLFKVRYTSIDETDVKQMPVYGVHLRFGKNDELISVE